MNLCLEEEVKRDIARAAKVAEAVRYEYLALLRGHGAQISMSRATTPSDNPKMKRFVRTIKDEEVYLRDYADFDEAARSIVRFIHRYNTTHAHSSLVVGAPIFTPAGPQFRAA